MDPNEYKPADSAPVSEPAAPVAADPAPVQSAPAAEPAKAKGYGKRPLWQWVLIYVVVAIVLYYGIYLLFFHHAAGSGY
jgi:hypothetical protein